jgi:uncharacterized protein (DUF433 family)
MQQVQLPELLRTMDLVRPSDPRSGLISVDPETMGGTPCFAGTRIPIKHLWDYVEGGGTIEEFMDDFEGVPRDLCTQVLTMARERLLEGLPTA